MVTINEFQDRISELKGVKSYMLLRNDGKVIANNAADPDRMTSVIMLNGFCSEALKSPLENLRFKHSAVAFDNGDKLYIFQIGRYLLGVQYDSAMENDKIIFQVQTIMKSITKKKNGVSSS